MRDVIILFLLYLVLNKAESILNIVNDVLDKLLKLFK